MPRRRAAALPRINGCHHEGSHWDRYLGITAAMTQVPWLLSLCQEKEVFDIVAQEKGENPWNSRKFVVSLPPNKNANEREQTISKD